MRKLLIFGRRQSVKSYESHPLKWVESLWGPINESVKAPIVLLSFLTLFLVPSGYLAALNCMARGYFWNIDCGQSPDSYYNVSGLHLEL